jgi:hypothetical protein
MRTEWWQGDRQGGEQSRQYERTQAGELELEQQTKQLQCGHQAHRQNQGKLSVGWGLMTAWGLEQKAAVKQKAIHSQVLPRKHQKAHHQLEDA